MKNNDTTVHHPWQLWKRLLVNKHLSQNRKNYRILWQLFQSTPKLSWSRYLEMDPTADSFIQQGLYSQDLWLCSASLEYLKLLFEYVGKKKQEESSLFRTAVQVAKLLVTVHLERMEFLIIKARKWRFEQRGFVHQVASLWRAIFRMDEMIAFRWMSKVISMQSSILIYMVKSVHHHYEGFMHELIFLWKIWNKVAGAKELEYLYGKESLFVRKVLQHIAHCQDAYWILQILKTLRYQHGQRWKHARVRMIRNGLSRSFIQTIAQWSIADTCEEQQHTLAHPLDNQEIRQLAKEWIYLFIGRVSYWVNIEELTEMAIRLPLQQSSHFRLVEQLLEWRPSLSSHYLLRCHFHKMDPEPSPDWIFQALALIKALHTDENIQIPTTMEEDAKTCYEYCMQIWPLESKDSCWERILLYTEHLLCPWIGFQILLHILNRLQRYMNELNKIVSIHDEQWTKDIEWEVVSRLPDFQVIWAVIRRELKQLSVISSESMKWMEHLKTFHSMFYFVPLEPQHMNMELLTLGLQVIACYRKIIPWLEKEQRWDISKIFFASPINHTNGYLEYHWIVPYLQHGHLLHAVLNHIHISISRHDGDSIRVLIASQQGPRHFSRLGQLLYLYALYIQRTKESTVNSHIIHLLYTCICEIGKASGCFDSFELHFWLYWLSFACEIQAESNNLEYEEGVLQELCIAWFEHLWIELWRKPFLIWDMKRDAHVNYLITLAILRKLANPKSEQQVRRWFVMGIACFIRLQYFPYISEEEWNKERMEWWKMSLEQMENIHRNEELLWLKGLFLDKNMGKGMEESIEFPLSSLEDMWNQWSLGKKPIIIENWKELEEPLISEEWKRSCIEQLLWTPSHRLVILQTLLYQWNMKRGRMSLSKSQHFHDDIVTNHVLEWLSEIIQRISFESLEEYVNLLWNHSIWKQWLKHSYEFFVCFTKYWTSAMENLGYVRRLEWHPCLEKCMPIVMDWIEKECSDNDLVQHWLDLLSYNQRVRLLERLFSQLVRMCDSQTIDERGISNIVDKLIVVFEKCDNEMSMKYSLPDTLKQSIEWGWNGVIISGRKSELCRKEWERLWSVMMTRRWLSLHVWLGIVMQTNRSHLMHLMLEWQQLHNVQHRQWRGQWMDWMLRRYPKIVGIWLRWIHHKRRKWGKNEERRSIAAIVFLLKPSSLMEWNRKIERWISTLLLLFYRSLWYERKHSTILWLEEYSSNEWIQMAIQNRVSRTVDHRWKRIAWRWVKHLFRKHSLSTKKGKLKNHKRMKGFLLGLDTLDILLLDTGVEQRNSLLDMMTYLLDWSGQILHHGTIQPLNDDNNDDLSILLFTKYVNILWKVFYACIGQQVPHCSLENHQVCISYHSHDILYHVKLSNEKCLQWLQSILSCLQRLAIQNEDQNDHANHSSSCYITKLCWLITIEKHILLWYHLNNKERNELQLSECNEWIKNWIQWTMHVLENSSHMEMVKTNLLSFIQLLLALMLSEKVNNETILCIKDESTRCISLHTNTCVENHVWLLLQMQKIESGMDCWLNRKHMQHKIFVIGMVISRYLWIEESHSFEFPWLKQSCFSILHRLDSRRIKQTIEYILSKRKEWDELCRMDNHILWHLSDHVSVVLYLIQNSIMEEYYDDRQNGKHAQENIINDDVVDPSLLLSLIFQVLKISSQNDVSRMIDQIQLFTDKHLIEFCMACLSVKNEKIQWISRACLEYGLNILSRTKKKYFSEAQSMAVFLTLLKNSMTEFPVDSFLIRLNIQLWEIFCQPTHVLYMPLVKTCLDSGMSWDAPFFRLLSKEWCLSLLSMMETRQDFEMMGRIEIFEDCWRLLFGYSETKRNQLFCKQGLVMLSKVIHHGEAQMVLEMDKCWGVISGIHMLWKKYPDWCCWLLEIYISFMEKCDVEMSPFPWLNTISYVSGRRILLRCLKIFKKCKWDMFSSLSEWNSVWLPKLSKEPFLQWEYSRWLLNIHSGQPQNNAILCKLHWQQLLIETGKMEPQMWDSQNEENMDNNHDIWYEYDKVTLLRKP
ncbi:hypothetical protein Gasu2_18860 [Galdieria sulphuraria]|nr:hypothetical protein Gasu2_18860 [Galdieria sulphuraria]